MKLTPWPGSDLVVGLAPISVEIHKFPCYDVIRKSRKESSVSFAGWIEWKLENNEANPCCYGFAFVFVMISAMKKSSYNMGNDPANLSPCLEKCVQEGAANFKTNRYEEVWDGRIDLQTLDVQVHGSLVSGV